MQTWFGNESSLESYDMVLKFFLQQVFLELYLLLPSVACQEAATGHMNGNFIDYHGRLVWLRRGQCYSTLLEYFSWLKLDVSSSTGEGQWKDVTHFQLINLQV